jgi:hypothetical protein
MNELYRQRPAVSLIACLALAACGGGGSSGGGPPANRAPTANAGPDQTVEENTTVNLDGSGSFDLDGDTISYSWTQTGGADVGLSGASTAAPSFTAPDVAQNNPEIFTFQLTVSDGNGSTDTDTVEVTVLEALAAINISGRLYYELPVRNNDSCDGYNFSNIQNRPVRGALVQLIDTAATPNVLASIEAGPDGSYSFSNINARQDVRVRVVARLLETGTQSWEAYVRDNTSETFRPLTNRPIYAVAFPVFNTGIAHITDRDFIARTGWDGTAYTGERNAGKLAILDAIYDATQLVAGVDPDVDLGRIDAFWSENNTWVEDNFDVAAGRLQTTYFTDDPERDGVRNPSLFLLGDAIGRFPGETVQVDTDEFDRGVVIHEWGHFFEDELSRSDSIGGRHVIPGTVEPRVAFGEGWGYAIGAIGGGDPIVCDTGSPSSTGSALDMETWRRYGLRGFFNEMSIAQIIYDLFDTENDGEDTGSVGFAAIYETMTADATATTQRNTEAFTTIFSFATYLKDRIDPSGEALLNALLDREDIDPAPLDIWGSGQTRQPSLARDFLPIYTDLPSGASGIDICTNNDYDPDKDGNKPGEWRYLRFTTTGESRWRIEATATQTPSADTSDPDFWLYDKGTWLNACDPFGSCQLFGSGVTGADNTETLNTVSLPAGTYVIAFNDWRYEDPAYIVPVDHDQSCFTITRNPL